MRKTQIFSVLVSFICLLSLTGCGDVSPRSETTAAQKEIIAEPATEAQESYTISVNATDILSTLALPDQFSVCVASDAIVYPSRVTLFDSVGWVDFSEMATSVCSVLLGNDYENPGDGEYTLEKDGKMYSLHLSTELQYTVDNVNGKGGDLLTRIIDYTSSLYDSQDAQKNNTLRSYYTENEELEGLPLQEALQTMVETLAQLGISNVEPVYTGTLTAEVLQQQLEAYLAAKRSYWDDETFEEEYGMYQNISFSTEDECYMMIFCLQTAYLPTMTGNENTAETALAGTEIRCLYGREGLIQLYCKYIPDFSAAIESSVETIMPEDALNTFLETYAVWQTRDMSIVSIDLEYVVHRTVDDDNMISFYYVPAWVICTEYQKSFISEEETLSYTYHDYTGIHAGTGELLSMNE